MGLLNKLTTDGSQLTDFDGATPPPANSPAAAATAGRQSARRPPPLHLKKSLAAQPFLLCRHGSSDLRPPRHTRRSQRPQSQPVWLRQWVDQHGRQ